MLLACAFGAPAWAEEGILNKAKKEVGEALVGKEETKAEAQKVKVKISDGSLDMPNRLTAGKVTFSVENTGKEKHSFKIAGEGVQELLEKIKPGETRTLSTNLSHGTYTASCPELPGGRLTVKVTEK